MGDSSGPSDHLEGFLALAKNAKGKASVMVIQQVLKHPAIFVFGELLVMDTITALQGSEHQPWLDLLKLFASGTYEDYVARKDTLSLPPLGAAEEAKLKKLSVCTYASRSNTLQYTDLMQQLSVQSVRELEDLVIDACYTDLVSCKLDQQSGQVFVQFAAGRDMAPGDVDEMLGKLDTWLEASETALQHLDRNVTAADAHIAERRAQEEKVEEEKKNIVAAIKIQQAEAPSVGGSSSSSSSGSGGGGGVRNLLGNMFGVGGSSGGDDGNEGGGGGRRRKLRLGRRN